MWARPLTPSKKIPDLYSYAEKIRWFLPDFGLINQKSPESSAFRPYKCKSRAKVCDVTMKLKNCLA